MNARKSLGDWVAIIAGRRALRITLSLAVFPLANALLSAAGRDGLPLFLDSIFTAIAAAIFGPLYGVLTAVMTNALNEAVDGFPGVHIFFAICGVATALIVGGFVRSGRYRTVLDWCACIVAVTLANAVLGAFVATFAYGGGTRMNLDNIVAGFMLFTDSILAAAFLARLPINLIDKAIAVAPAFALLLARDKAIETASGPSAERR